MTVDIHLHEHWFANYSHLSSLETMSIYFFMNTNLRVHSLLCVSFIHSFFYFPKSSLTNTVSNGAWNEPERVLSIQENVSNIRKNVLEAKIYDTKISFHCNNIIQGPNFWSIMTVYCVMRWLGAILWLNKCTTYIQAETNDWCLVKDTW
jgi:hypothetical protein